MDSLTEILSQLDPHDATASEHLLPLVYDELRMLAASKLAQEKPAELLAIDEALTELAKTNEKAAQIVKLRFFVGLSIPEAAEIMNVSPRSANRLWAAARSWLAVELGLGDSDEL